jgi:hypothetical protein
VFLPKLAQEEKERKEKGKGKGTSQQLRLISYAGKHAQNQPSLVQRREIKPKEFVIACNLTATR